MNLISHRGNDDHDFLENTKEAILDVLSKKYIDGVEFDVRMTKDKKIILYHNMLIKTNNNYEFILNKTFLEITKINNKIITLDELLKNIKTNKILLIELKCENDNYNELIAKFINIVKKYNYLNIYICSFNYGLIKTIKNKYPHYKCGLIIGYLMNTNNITNEFDFFLYGSNYLKLINYDKEIFIFDINKKDKLKFIQEKLKSEFYIISDKSYLFV